MATPTTRAISAIGVQAVAGVESSMLWASSPFYVLSVMSGPWGSSGSSVAGAR